MVVALGPGRFYGSSLPRPRYLSDVKLNEERVDPPVPVLDPFIAWANEAHWSMGGLSFQRHRLQGRIEGSVKKLRVQQAHASQPKKASAKPRNAGVNPASFKAFDSEPSSPSEEIAEEQQVIAPVILPSPPKKKRARKLIDEFEKVAAEDNERSFRNDDTDRVSPKKSKSEEYAVVGVSSRTRSRRSPAGKESASGSKNGGIVRRTSPRKVTTLIPGLAFSPVL